jgi:hypothetical protein
MSLWVESTLCSMEFCRARSSRGMDWKKKLVGASSGRTPRFVCRRRGLMLLGEPPQATSLKLNKASRGDHDGSPLEASNAESLVESWFPPNQLVPYFVSLLATRETSEEEGLKGSLSSLVVMFAMKSLKQALFAL